MGTTTERFGFKGYWTTGGGECLFLFLEPCVLILICHFSHPTKPEVRRDRMPIFKIDVSCFFGIFHFLNVLNYLRPRHVLRKWTPLERFSSLFQMIKRKVQPCEDIYVLFPISGETAQDSSKLWDEHTFPLTLLIIIIILSISVLLRPLIFHAIFRWHLPCTWVYGVSVYFHPIFLEEIDFLPLICVNDKIKKMKKKETD